MKDERIIDLVRQVTKIETELPHIIDDIEDLKTQREKEPREVEAKKDKRFSKAFVIIGGSCGIISLLCKIYEMIFKKP